MCIVLGWSSHRVVKTRRTLCLCRIFSAKVSTIHRAILQIKLRVPYVQLRSLSAKRGTIHRALLQIKLCVPYVQLQGGVVMGW